PSVGERDGLAPGAEQAGEETLSRRVVERNEAAEQLLDVVEELALAAAHPDQRPLARCDEDDPAGRAGAGDLVRDLVRDVEGDERRKRAGNRIWDLDARHRSSRRRQVGAPAHAIRLRAFCPRWLNLLPPGTGDLGTEGNRVDETGGLHEPP